MVYATSNAVVEPKAKAPVKIVWRNVLNFTVLHILALYGLYRCFTSAMWQTILFAVFLDIASGLGVTAGVHRLWSHRAYKAKLPLRIALALFNTIAFENDIYEWCRDHRVHHKYSETDADPHNSKRGFFFAHMGWLLMRKHPDVIEKGKTIDLSDLLADPVVRFQRRYYKPLVVICCFTLPTVIPMVFWGESFLNSFLIPTILRYTAMLHQTWLVNSAAHMWGYRPYDHHINPRENHWVVFGAIGEGFHNYHHTFPWDYASSEYGIRYNITTAFIDLMAWLGLAYDLKTVSPEIIRDRKLRTGEGRSRQNKAAVE